MGFGFAVAGVPDLTGDGKGDVLIGALRWDDDQFTIQEGAVFVYNGATGVLHDSIESPDSVSEGNFGASVAGVPDLNGDGRGDILVGAPGEFGEGTNDRHGQAHVFSGSNGSFIRTLASPNPEHFGQFGFCVTDTPDRNGDGKAELLVGAPSEHAGGFKLGRVYCFRSSDGTLDFTRTPSAAAWDGFGRAISMRKDVNADGEADLLVGSPNDDGFSGAAYLFRPVENDGCSYVAAPPIPVGNGSWAFTTVGASTTGPAESECLYANDAQVSSDVFFTYTANCDGVATISTCGSADYDSRIAVYAGCGSLGSPLFACDLGSILACNDDAAGCGFQSKVSVPVSNGDCLLIRIGGFGSAQGSGSFSVECSGGCLGDIDANGAVDAADLALLLGQWNGSGSADLNGDQVVGAADLAILLGAWGKC